MNYDRLIRSFQGFLEQREKDGVAKINGKLPRAQQIKMDSIFRQVFRIANKEIKEIANENCGESIWDSVVRFARERVRNEEEVTSDLGKVWAAERIAELEKQLQIDTLNPNRRTHIIELQERINKLERDLAHEVYEHYCTCESEGLEWGGDIPEKPEDY